MGEVLASTGGGPADNEVRLEKLRLYAGIAAVAAALAGTATAVLGVLPAREAATAAKTKADTSQVEVQALTDENKKLTDENKALTSQVQDLTDQLAARGPSPEDPANATPTVYYHHHLDLAANRQVDLDATSPQFSQTANGELDMGYQSNHLYFRPFSGGGIAVNDPATYDTCHEQSGFSKQSVIPIETLQRRKTVCVLTSGGRFSVLKIISVKPDFLSFDVTTYAKDGD